MRAIARVRTFLSAPSANPAQWRRLRADRGEPAGARTLIRSRVTQGVLVGVVAVGLTVALAASASAKPKKTYSASAWRGLIAPPVSTRPPGLAPDLSPAAASPTPAATPAPAPPSPTASSVCKGGTATATATAQSTSEPAIGAQVLTRPDDAVGPSTNTTSTPATASLASDVTGGTLTLPGSISVPVPSVTIPSLGTTTTTTMPVPLPAPTLTAPVLGPLLAPLLGPLQAPSSGGTSGTGSGSSSTPATTPPAAATPAPATSPTPAPSPGTGSSFGGSPGAWSGGIGCNLVGSGTVGLPTAGESSIQAAAVKDALMFLGVAYVWGGESSRGFDCSGLVQAAYREAGVSLPRVAQDQYDAGPVVSPGQQVVPGDLVFFGTGPGDVSHVGMFVGNGLMVDAPHTGATVRFDRVDGFGSIVGITAPGSAGVHA